METPFPPAAPATAACEPAGDLEGRRQQQASIRPPRRAAAYKLPEERIDGRRGKSRLGYTPGGRIGEQERRRGTGIQRQAAECARGGKIRHGRYRYQGNTTTAGSVERMVVQQWQDTPGNGQHAHGTRSNHKPTSITHGAGNCARGTPEGSRREFITSNARRNRRVPPSRQAKRRRGRGQAGRGTRRAAAAAAGARWNNARRARRGRQPRANRRQQQNPTAATMRGPAGGAGPSAARVDFVTTTPRNVLRHRNAAPQTSSNARRRHVKRLNGEQNEYRCRRQLNTGGQVNENARRTRVQAGGAGRWAVRPAGSSTGQVGRRAGRQQKERAGRQAAAAAPCR